jgi:hypothetical protein
MDISQGTYQIGVDDSSVLANRKKRKGEEFRHFHPG